MSMMHPQVLAILQARTKYEEMKEEFIIDIVERHHALQQQPVAPTLESLRNYLALTVIDPRLIAEILGRVQATPEEEE